MNTMTLIRSEQKSSITAIASIKTVTHEIPVAPAELVLIEVIYVGLIIAKAMP
jgi:hypothetical protein